MTRTARALAATILVPLALLPAACSGGGGDGWSKDDLSKDVAQRIGEDAGTSPDVTCEPVGGHTWKCVATGVVDPTDSWILDVETSAGETYHYWKVTGSARER